MFTVFIHICWSCTPFPSLRLSYVNSLNGHEGTVAVIATSPTLGDIATVCHCKTHKRSLSKSCDIHVHYIQYNIQVISFCPPIIIYVIIVYSINKFLQLTTTCSKFTLIYLSTHYYSLFCRYCVLLLFFSLFYLPFLSLPFALSLPPPPPIQRRPLHVCYDYGPSMGRRQNGHMWRSW